MDMRDALQQQTDQLYSLVPLPQTVMVLRNPTLLVKCDV